MKDWIRRWGPALGMMVLIFIASGTPGSDLPKFGKWDFLVRKGAHMAGYALLALSYGRALHYGKKPSQGQLAVALGLAVLYASSDEFHQRFTPGRNASPVDVLIDAAGAAGGLALWLAARPWRRAPTEDP